MTASATWSAGSVPAGPVEAIPGGGFDVRGRRLAGPMQGFGSLWQKTFSVRLEGVRVSPEEVAAELRGRLVEFLPPMTRFRPSPGGIRTGEVVAIDSVVSGWPVSTGVLVLHADALAFTLMTPDGHPESGWNTFRARDDGGVTVVEIESLGRAGDPIYELGARFLGGAWEQERTWRHVLRRVARHYGVRARPRVVVECIDPRVQWSRAGNVWWNAMVRTTLRALVAPFRRRGERAAPVGESAGASADAA